MPAKAKRTSSVPAEARTNRVFARGFDRWLMIRNLAPSTRRGYLKAVDTFLEFLRSRSAVEADLRTLHRFLFERAEKGAGPHQIAHSCYALRAFYKFLVLNGLMRSSPAMLLETPKLPHRLPRCCSESETERLLAAAESLRDKALLELLYASGLRSAEAAGLRIGDLDLKGKTLRVRHGKGDKERIAFFGSKAAAALRAYLAGRESGPVFLTRVGQQLSTRSIREIVRRVAARAGVSRVHPHSLRHAFASHILNRGVDVRYVQEFLGHANVRTTQISTHLAIADLQRVHARHHPRGGGSHET